MEKLLKLAPPTWPALKEAIKMGHTGAAKVLLEDGRLTINETMLRYALKHKQWEIAELLEANL